MIISLIILFSISTVSAETIRFQNLTQQGCTNTVFVISTGGITPWPVVPGGPMTVAVYGTFQHETYVQEYNVGLQYNAMEWVYWDNQFVKKSYAEGAGTSFTTTFACPVKPGKYFMMVDLTSGSHIGCWTLNFVI